MVGAIWGVIPFPGAFNCHCDGSCGRQVCKGTSLHSQKQGTQLEVCRSDEKATVAVNLCMGLGSRLITNAKRRLCYKLLWLG